MNFNELFHKTLANQNLPPAAGNGGGLSNFDTVEAAPEFSPLPPGVYTASVLSGVYTATRKGDDAYRVRFEITEGEQSGKTVSRTWTFGPKAIAYSKRDLAAFGLTTTAKLRSPFPEPGKEYRVRLVVSLQTGDDGVQRNDIKNITVLEVTDTPDAEFLLPPAQDEGGPK
jgi:hypothetical protein